MKRVILFFAVVMMLLFATSIFAQVKIGVFDMQEVMVKSLNGAQIKKDLEKKKAYYTNEIKKRESALKKMKQDLEKKAMMLSKDARDQAENDYQKKLRDLKLYASDSENDLKQMYRDRTQWLINDILKFARDFAKKKNFTILIERQEGGVVFADKSIDITEALLKAYNEYSLKKKK